MKLWNWNEIDVSHEVRTFLTHFPSIRDVPRLSRRSPFITLDSSPLFQAGINYVCLFDLTYFHCVLSAVCLVLLLLNLLHRCVKPFYVLTGNAYGSPMPNLQLFFASGLHITRYAQHGLYAPTS